MFRKIASALFIVGLGVGLAFGEDFGASIRKIEDGKVTFVKFSKDKEKKGEEQTLPVAADVKVVKAKFNKETKKVEAGDDLTDGLKNELFKTIGEKGVYARISTDADGKKITEIRVIQRKKKDS